MTGDEAHAPHYDQARYEADRAQGEAGIERLIAKFPELTHLRDEHVSYFEGMLPHLLIGEVIDWLAQKVDNDPDEVARILGYMDLMYREGPEPVRNLLVASGVESLPKPGQPGDRLRDLLGPELRKFDDWPQK